MSAAPVPSAIGELRVYPSSVSHGAGAAYFLARRGDQKLVGCLGQGRIAGNQVATHGGRPVIAGPLSAANAAAIRQALPWTAPSPIGQRASIGLGDRLGLATPAHVRAVRGSGLAAVLAQQSIREMTRTARTPRQVLDDATWGVLQEGFTDGFGADADHLQQPEDIDACAAAGFTMFTIDPGRHVRNDADTLGASELRKECDSLDWDSLGVSQDDLRRSYVGRRVALHGGGDLSFDELTFLRAAVKYGGAVAHTVTMYRRLREVAGGPFELEVSVDETETATSPAEHWFIASELRRCGVEFASLAPRFVGRFEKGVDYLGDLEAFRRSFAAHVAVMRTLGPYKLSVHSGSDKFRIYPIVAELAGGRAHLKTAGTSYLEALRAVARIDPALFQAILGLARQRYAEDRSTYHVSAELADVPDGWAVQDDELPTLLDRFDVRQVLHVTFGSVLTADGGARFGQPLRQALARNEEAHYGAVERHLRRHVRGLAGGA